MQEMLTNATREVSAAIMERVTFTCEATVMHKASVSQKVQAVSIWHHTSSFGYC